MSDASGVCLCSRAGFTEQSAPSAAVRTALKFNYRSSDDCDPAADEAEMDVGSDARSKKHEKSLNFGR